MTGKEYQTAAMRTSSQYISTDQHLLNGALGLAGEAGEVADLIKKIMFQGHSMDWERIAKELENAKKNLADTAEQAFRLVKTFFK